MHKQETGVMNCNSTKTMSEPLHTSTTTVTPPNLATITPPYPANISYKNHHINTLHGGTTTTTPTTTTTTIRDYRKGNWTPDETLILITAKKLDDERRINNTAATTTSNSRAGGGELRWKWVENYCWSNGCLRSQNQCNDKWDNLLRDYKKIRDYELRSVPANTTTQNQNHRPSYWVMDKTQRKHRNLPSNMLLNIYEALNDVVQRKYLPQKNSFQQQQQLPAPPLAALPPPPPPPPHPVPVPVPVPPPPLPPPPASEGSSGDHQSQGDDQATEKVDCETKRRRRVLRADDDDNCSNIEATIIQSTKLLSETLKHQEDNREKRHNQLMELQHQRLQLEETRTQLNRQGITALITSINKLSDAIHALISQKPTS